MINQVYEIIDKLENEQIIKELKEIKAEIKNDEISNDLIRRFEKAKDLYNEYNLKDEFLTAKNELINNPLINRYLKIQNEINLLTIYINEKIRKITDNK